MTKCVADLDEECRGLLIRVVESLGYRELMLANIRGHGLKYVVDGADRLRLVAELELLLHQFREIERLYSALGRADVVSSVRHKTERIPYPASRAELALCLFLCDKTSRAAMSAYVDCACRDLDAICRSRLESIPARSEPEDPIFVEFCSEPTNRAHAQQMLNRWLAIGLLALGRPGSPGDERAVALGLRRKRTAVIVREHLAELAPFVRRCGLVVPDAATLGLEMPAASMSAGR